MRPFSQNGPVGLGSRGFSLIEAVVVVALLGLTTIGSLSVMDHMATEKRAIADKINVLSLQQELLSKFSAVDFCSCLLRNRRFDVRRSNAKASVPRIPERYDASCSPEGNIIRVDRVYDNSRIRPTHIEIVEVNPAIGDNYSGMLRIRLNQNELIRKLPDIRIPVQLHLNPAHPASRKAVVSCAHQDEPKDPLAEVARGLANIPLQRGTFSRRINFPRSANFDSPPLVLLQSKWQYTSGSEDTAFWTTNVTTRSFVLNSHGPSGNEDQRGERGIYWIAIPQ